MYLLIHKKYFLLTILFITVILPAASLLLPLSARAHGVNISSSLVSGIEITALYDSGQPMAGGQVSVFTPDDPATPWLTGLCDEEGKFFFVPDYSNPGLWEVQVRLAGHGDIIRIEVFSDETAELSDAPGLNLFQKLLMVLTVSWGALGTGLFFSRRKR